MPGKPAARPDVPCFWSQHHDVTLVDGDLDARDAEVTYRLGGEVVATVTINRDRRGLEVEAALEDRLR